MKKFGLVIIIISNFTFAQPWNYNFGTDTGTHTSGVSETFLPVPETNGGTARVRVGTGGGSFNLEANNISFGDQSYLRGVAPTGTSVNKFSVYDYTASKSFTIRFSLRLGAVNGSSSGATSGTWYFFIGDGATYSDNNNFNGNHVFTGLSWVFDSEGAIITSYRNGSSWSLISGPPFTQGTNYIVDIYGNNTTSPLTYNYNGSQSVDVNTFDLWINGNLVGDDLNKALLPEDENIDSWMFIGVSSEENVANIFIDDIYYSNAITENPLPVELTSFSASIIGSTVKLNWRTETEQNNYGFEIQRLQDYKIAKLQDWETIGFVEGYGNSNSPKDYSFTDNSTSSGKYSYRLKQIDTDGSLSYSKIIEVDLGSPRKFELTQNFPNPFNPNTAIRFSLPETGNVKLTVYNMLGQEVAVLINGITEAGTYIINFDATGLNSGVYLYKIESGSFNEVRKMTLIK